MKQQLEEIRAKYLRTFQRWGETVIVELDVQGRSFAKAKGKAEELELVEGLWYRFYGRWSTHYRYGPQFVFETFVAMKPLDQDGLVRYLSQAPHVGKTIARRLVQLFGSDAVKILREEPEQSAKEAGVKTFTAAKAKEAAAFLEGEKAVEEATVDLIGILAGKGFPRDLPKKCIRRWGNKAHEILRAEPYLLLAFRWVGFLKADALYLSLGHDPRAIVRQGMCAWYACASDTEGHTWLEGNAVVGELLSKLGSAGARPREAIQWAMEAELLQARKDAEGRVWLADKARFRAEHSLAESVAKMLHYGAPDWPGVEDFDISDHQKEELAKALAGRIALFGGSPGTGKTYSAARLIAKILVKHGRDQVAVVAPTGKAAVRISEALEAYGLGLRATTVHSYLEVGGSSQEGSGDEDFSFRRGPDCPVDERFVIVDESSMLDTWLLSKLLAALPMDGHVLLVGDVNQLPPVGHGAPLRDLIAADVPRGELTEIRRNAGAIVRTCAAMRDGAQWSLPGRIDLDAGDNLIIMPTPSSNDSAEQILTVLSAIRRGREHDDVWDCQVICAVNEKSPLSRKDLNRKLQADQNGANRPLKDARFWPQDKVVCLKNSWLPISEDLMEDAVESTAPMVVRENPTSNQAEVYVANGEIGCVLEDEPRRSIVEFFSPHRYVIVPKGEDGGSVLDLGYAISAHKSQGSEWPIVLVVLDDYGGARLVCDRSWLYTSISRAKKACILIGKEETARDMVKRVKIWQRKTALLEQLAEKRAELEELSKKCEETEPATVGAEKEAS